MDSTERATLWAITWYPKEDPLDKEKSEKEIKAFAQKDLPPGCKLQGQMEQCPTTMKYHYQASLKTPQMRWSAAKKVLNDDTVHIEKARNRTALMKYNEKEETRVAKIESKESIPSIFDYQTIIAQKWDWNEFTKFTQEYIKIFPRRAADQDELAMRYLDSLVAADIESGRRGAEWIATNPMWINAWKKFWRSIIKRNGASTKADAEEASPADAPADAQADCEIGVCDSKTDDCSAE